MKIRYCSDLHIEFNGLPSKKVFAPSVDEILLVAGDTVPIVYLQSFRNDGRARSMKKKFCKFLDHVSKFKEVYMIMGNHEHYGGNIDDDLSVLKSFIKKENKWSNIHVLENSYAYLGSNVYLLGATMWTNVRNECPHSLMFIEGYMNDFRGQIKKWKSAERNRNSTRNFTPDDSVILHKESLSYFAKIIDQLENSKELPTVIIMTHHAPSYESSVGNARIANEGAAAYYSDLQEWILNRPSIKYWIHGHTHHNVNYNIGNCNVLANMRGYGVFGYEDACFKTFSLEPCIEIKRTP